MSFISFLIFSFIFNSFAYHKCRYEYVYNHTTQDPLIKETVEKGEYIGCNQRIGSVILFFTAKQVDKVNCPKICEHEGRVSQMKQESAKPAH